MKTDIANIVDFVSDYLIKTGSKKVEDAWGPTYRWEHTLRVAYWAWRLAVEEKADIEKCVVAALFHDVSHFVSENYRKHGIKSAEIAKDFMHKEGYMEDFVEDVAYAIESHVGEANPKTLESKILQDADTIDRFGYFRILLFGKEAKLSDLQALTNTIKGSLEYLDKVDRGFFGPMWTELGGSKLKELMNINRSVQKGILEELEKTKRPEAYL